MKQIFLFLVLGLFSFSVHTKETIKIEKATLAAGCFWGVEHYFRKLPGVSNTKVGYIGGHKVNPKYYDVSNGTTGHAEAIQFEYDSKKISYKEILNLFFKMHDPTTKDRQGNDVGTQYRSAIFYHSEDQKKIAEEFMRKVDQSKAWKKPITTELKQASVFYPAEEEHQNYLIKNPGGYDNHYERKISFDKENP